MSELISVGGYGCVYKPAISCSGKSTRENSFISKLQVYNKSSINEINIGNKLKKFKAHFGLPESSCKVRKSNMVKKDCPLTKEHEQLVLIKMKYIENRSFFDLVIADELLESQIYFLLHSFSFLVKSIHILKKQGIIHYDLKLDNILYDVKSNSPKIIDFGISIEKSKISLTDLKETFWVYAPWYYVWSPDIHFMCYIVNVNRNPSRKDVEKLIYDYIKGNEILQLIPKKELDEYKKKYVNYLSGFIGMSETEIAKIIISNSDTWDLYSLGLIYIKLVYFLKNKNKVSHEFFDFFLDVLYKTIHPNPIERLSDERLLNTIYGYVTKFRIQTDTINAGFTKKYIDTVKRYHRTHWRKLEDKLMECSIQK